MLQIDRVRQIEGARIVCEMDLDRDHWVFSLHLPDDPVFPGCLLIEAAGQVVALWGWDAGLRGRPRMARVTAEFASAVRPGDAVLTLTAKVRRRRQICFGSVDILVGERRVATLDLTIVVLTGHEGAVAEDAKGV